MNKELIPTKRLQSSFDRTETPLLILGTRPEVIKLAPLYKEMQARGLKPKIISTGQQRELVHQACSSMDLSIDMDLDLMQQNQSPESFLGRSIPIISEILSNNFPSPKVFIQGDTTSALSGAMAAFYKKLEIFHIEAGLRTNNLYSPFPEEGHRQIIGKISNIHFCPTPDDAKNLQREGIHRRNIIITGNTVIDNIIKYKEKEKETSNKIIVTTHRRENSDNKLHEIIMSVRELAEKNPHYDIIFQIHPNPRIKPVAEKYLSDVNNIFLINPMNYHDFINQIIECRFLITDSGGLQEEAPVLGKPLIVVRDITERPLGIKAGAAFLVGSKSKEIIGIAKKLINDEDFYKKSSKPRFIYGDGLASTRIVSYLIGENFKEFAPNI